MIDFKIVLANESHNLGNSIHLYRISDTDIWCAFGHSAYAFRMFCKSNGFTSIRTYTSRHALPCTCSSIKAVEAIAQKAQHILRQDKKYLLAEMADVTDPQAYAKWLNKLKGVDLDKIPEIEVSTHVSHLVPSNEFIPDGMSSISRNAKRLFDLIASGIALICFSPLFLYCWLTVRHEDGGPAIYSQERIGRFGRPFHIYKFRSMRLDAEKFGPQLSHSGGNNDPRLTKIGRFIRAHHLDELPQLWNVFCGDMSFVGPRPERRFFIDQIMAYDSRYAFLYQIRPGVTSYATLHNGYTDTMEKMLRRLEYDLYYLGHRSFLFDIKVLVKTFLRIIFGAVF